MKAFIWTDGDLDGAGSFLALKWLLESSGSIVDNDFVYNGSEVYVKLSDWFELHYREYDKIFICDISLDETTIELVDREKVVVIDHHKTHLELKDKYKNAKPIIEDHTSTCDLIRQKFKLDKHEWFKKKELDFLTRVDDYDSYKLKYPESIKLNIILKRRKYKNFVDDFKGGLRPFTEKEVNMVKIFFKELKEQLDGTQYFEGQLKGYKVIALYVDRYSSETAHIVLNRTGADICFAVNLKYKSVSLRKRIGCPVKLNVIAERFCNGGGHEFAAAGKLTDRFAELIKDFKNVAPPNS